MISADASRGSTSNIPKSCFRSALKASTPIAALPLPWTTTMSSVARAIKRRCRSPPRHESKPLGLRQSWRYPSRHRGSPHDSQYLLTQAPRTPARRAVGLAYSCISSSNPEPPPPDLPSVLFSRETRPYGGALKQRCSHRVTAHGTGLAETSRGSHTNGQGLGRASRRFVTSSL